MHQLIIKEQCRHVVDWLKEEHLEFYLESIDELFASVNFVREAAPVLEMIFDEALYCEDVNEVSFI